MRTARRRPSPEHVERFLALVAPKNATLESRALLAATDPERYEKRFAKRRDARNQDEDDDVDVWLEIVDALGEAKLACGLDWKFSAADIEWNLRRVMKAKKLDDKKLFAFYDEDAHIETKTLDFIKACGRAFSAHGVALVELDISSDSYELTLVPWNDRAKVEAAAKAIGGKVISHAPAKPIATPLAAVTKKPMGKFLQFKIPGDAWGTHFEALNGVHSYTEKATLLFDCRVWPPKKIVVKEPRTSAVISDAGTILFRVMHAYDGEAFAPKASGTLLVRKKGKPEVDLLAKLPDHFDLEAPGFIGDLVVLLPTEPTVRGKHTKRPLVWDGKRLSPAKGLRDAVPPKPKGRGELAPFLRRGFARTGSGIDVLVWEGKGFVAKGGALKEACTIANVPLYDVFRGAPAEGDAFYYVSRKSRTLVEIREVRFAEKEATRTKIPWLVEKPVAAPGGAIVLGVNRYGQTKSPALVVWHPASNERTDVPATAFGIRRDDSPNAWGTGGNGNDAFLWLMHDDAVRCIPWSGVMGLPRKR